VVAVGSGLFFFPQLGYAPLRIGEATKEEFHSLLELPGIVKERERDVQSWG